MNDFPLPADRVATPRGPLGVEQPFVGFDEMGEDVYLWESFVDGTYSIDIPQSLYVIFREKYGWPEGTQIYITPTPDFQGFKATAVVFPLDALPY